MTSENQTDKNKGWCSGMFDKQRFQETYAKYKQEFASTNWPKEKYKWEAVQWFQDHWDVNAPEFVKMLKAALAKADNLLTSQNNFPKAMIIGFATDAPEEVRAMFIELFDENKDVIERIQAFKDRSVVLLKKYGRGAAQHFQKENAISTYLWLRFPDKYYIYKYSEVKNVADELQCDYSFKKGAYTENLRHFYQLYNELNIEIRQDSEIKELLHSVLTPECYPDPELRTITADYGFYVSRYIVEEKKQAAKNATDMNESGLTANEWYPSVSEYTPGFTKEQWIDLLNSKKVIGPIWGGTLAAFYSMGGAATCTQIGKKYDKSPYSISGYCTNLAKRIQKETNCPILKRDNGQNKYWPILFQGKKAGPDIEGDFIWKIRPELMEALNEFDIMRYEWKPEEELLMKEGENVQYWWLNANPKIWSFSNLSVGESQSYTLYNENGNKRRVYQYFLDAKVGDKVVGYESYPVKQIVALARVSGEQDGQKILFEKTEGLSNPLDYTTLKNCPELENMEYFVNPQGSLFKLTKDEYDFILDMIRDENPLAKKTEEETYTKDDFLEDVYMTEARYDHLVSVLQNKKNIILQGAPGVGKTYAAKRLAYSMMGKVDVDRIEFVQFHQNYSYEDFVMGYKPSGEGFELKNGIFYRFCQKAANQPGKEFFFIIDEINRGNMSKIFGELLMLIEKDYRGTKATLAYNGLPFAVPENLYIIGMMNTADRSLAMIDYALRRRFSFFEIEPGFDSDGFVKYCEGLQSETMNELISRVRELNKEIAADKSLGKGFCIGHSYFCGRDICTDEWLQSVVEYDILPMLNEYWFDEPAKIQRWENILRGVFQ